MIWRYKTEQPKIGKEIRDCYSYQKNNNFKAVRPKALGQADRLLFLLEGTALLPSSGREQELVIRVQKTHTHAIVIILLFLR